MEFEFTRIESSLVSVRTSGLASAEGFADLYEKLAAEPGFGPGVKILSDHADLDVSGLTVGEMEQIAASRARYAGSLGARSALVAGLSSPAKYGLGRMFEALAGEAPGGLVEVFDTVEEARAWLRGTDDAAPSAP
jgi:hypothetical protein